MGEIDSEWGIVEYLRVVLNDKIGAGVELNATEWLRLKGQLPWVEFHDEGDVIWLFAGDTWPSNTVGGARFRTATAKNRIRELLAKHWEHKVACNWITGPASEPAELGKHLRANGFSCRIHTAGMACDLAKLPVAVKAPDGVRVELVETLPSLLPLTTERRKRRHQGRNILTKMESRKLWCFSATIDGKGVGETVLFTGNETAGIYDVEVLEKHRRRGIGSALMSAALEQARKLGHRLAVLGATGMGQGLYGKFEFQEVCKLSFWKYGKMRQLRYSGG